MSSESTWLLAPGGGNGANAAAAGGASDSEWSELHHAAVARRLTWRRDAGAHPLPAAAVSACFWSTWLVSYTVIRVVCVKRPPSALKVPYSEADLKM